MKRLLKSGSHKRGPNAPLRARPSPRPSSAPSGGFSRAQLGQPTTASPCLRARRRSRSPLRHNSRQKRCEMSNSYNMLERSLSSTVPPPRAVYSWLRFRAVRWYGRRTHSTSASACSIVPCRISYARKQPNRRNISTSRRLRDSADRGPRRTPHLKPGSDLCKLDLLVRGLDVDVVPAKRKVNQLTVQRRRAEKRIRRT